MANKIYSVYTDAPQKPSAGLFGETPQKIKFREEQIDAISRAKRHFEKKEGMQQYLWNAKMRFGKTLCALELARQMSEGRGANRKVRRVLIVTHRPVVNQSWKEDFDKIFGDIPETFKYGTKFENDSTGNFFDLEAHTKANENNGYVFFASMQYLRRSNLVINEERTEADQENEALRNAILENDWDLVVIDEAHEGTRTSLGLRVISTLRKEKTKLLHLSGTPFNLYEDFDKDEEIYQWDYVMEQKAKADWDKSHPGEYNPYAVLPHMNIFTYDLAKLVKGKDFAEDGAFKFKEFFRTWSGRKEVDGVDMPEGAKGRFVHEKEVIDFLNLMCKEDEESNYPFSTELYQENFNHTLWIVPGVKEAKALSQLLKEHEVFSNFEIINVAGNSDDDEKSDNALDLVLNKIGKRPSETATITISCGRLTTGVTVHPWTAVFYLKGSENTSAATYMQTIFRVQSTDTETYPGKMKAECYVFDFAPDRSLKMIAETAKFANLTTKQKRNANATSKEDDIATMSEFLNFFSVISLEGGKMVEYEAETLFKQLDHVYIDRVVRNGFNDNLIYDTSYLMQLDDNQLQRLNELGKIIEQTTNMEKPKSAKKVQLAENQLSKQQKHDAQQAKKNKREGKPLTPEQKAALEAEKAAKEAERKEKENRISILRGIALRIPLLIYGAKVDDENIGITIENLTERIDDASWKEFMPRGITKDIFEEIKPCFNAKMFALAGKRYRQLAREADEMHTDERVKRIAEIFSYFHNPDKETVLTPWRVVNMHMSNTLGGYCFFNERFDGPNQKAVEGSEGRLFDYIDTTEPRFVDKNGIANSVFSTSTKILEINSKTGLYPLYVTYSIYRQRMKDFAKHDLIEDVDNFSIEEEQVVWDDIIKNNIYVICNTPMAARITERTLLGFRDISSNNIKEDKLIDLAVQDSSTLIKKLKSPGYWKSNTNQTYMKFNAIVGNPPYQQIKSSDRSLANAAFASAIYPLMIDIACDLHPDYVSMITPSRWMTKTGQGVSDKWIDNMINNNHFITIHDYPLATECFKGVEIKGGVSYFLYSEKHNEKCNFISHNGKNTVTNYDYLNALKAGIVIRDPKALTIIQKVKLVEKDYYTNNSFSSLVGPVHQFDKDGQLGTAWQGYSKERNNIHTIKYYLNRRLESCGFGWISMNDIPKGHEALPLHKIFIPEAGGSGTDSIILGKPFYGEPNSICSETYISIGFDPQKHKFSKEECYNIISYIKTRFFRYMVSIKKRTQHATASVYQFVPIQDWSKPWTDAELYKKYNLKPEEIAYIESMIKPME